LARGQKTGSDLVLEISRVNVEILKEFLLKKIDIFD
jgi:hypothetical protein